jgi:hypothetical protein
MIPTARVAMMRASVEVPVRKVDGTRSFVVPLYVENFKVEKTEADANSSQIV